MEVIPGIHQLKVPIPDNPLGFLNAYLVEGNDGWLMVDTGWNDENAFEALTKQLEQLGISFEDIAQIVVTHVHADHYGLASRLRERSGAELLFHRLEMDIIESRHGDFDKLIVESVRWLHRHGLPKEEMPGGQSNTPGANANLVPHCFPDVILHGGEKITSGRFSFDVLWTPGHSMGHVCLHEPTKRILFSGDHILPIITPHVSRNNMSSDNPLADYINSLKAVENLEVDIILPAHEHIFHNLKQRVREILDHHDMRTAAILGAMGKEPKTAWELASQITWMPEEKEGGLTWDELPPSHKPLAMMETLAHLELMLSEGKVSKVTRDNVVFFQAA